MGEETTVGMIVRRLHEIKHTVEKAEFSAEVHHSTSGAPYLRVTNPRVPKLSEGIGCAHRAADGDALWLWWSWGEPICPAHDTARAVKEITHVLADRM